MTGATGLDVGLGLILFGLGVMAAILAGGTWAARKANRQRSCPDCYGSGKLGGDGPWCARCMGTGWVPQAGDW